MFYPYIIILLTSLPHQILSFSGLDHLEKHLNEISVNSYDDLTKSIIAENFPEFSNSLLSRDCVSQALETFLPICLEKGMEAVDTDIRVNTALSLSICQFESSKLTLDLREICSAHNPLSQCMNYLKLDPSLWTTYNGYYQKLSSICFENSLPYEKQQILNLFLKITDFYSKFNKDITVNFKDLRDAFFKANAKDFQNLHDFYEEHMINLSENFRKQAAEFNEVFDDIKSSATDEFSSTFDDLLLKQKEYFSDIFKENGKVHKDLSVLWETDHKIINNLSIMQSNLDTNFQNFVENINNILVTQIVNVENLEKVQNALTIQSSDILGNFEDDLYKIKIYNNQLFSEFQNYLNSIMENDLGNQLVLIVETLANVSLSNILELNQTFSETMKHIDTSLEKGGQKINITLEKTIFEIDKINQQLSKIDWKFISFFTSIFNFKFFHILLFKIAYYYLLYLLLQKFIKRGLITTSKIQLSSESLIFVLVIMAMSLGALVGILITKLEFFIIFQEILLYTKFYIKKLLN
ncbi:uncharacterized protein SCODWIG_03107 [Saccharomycodes ludwigii]|uniref:Nuclear fusion protein KAR5 n=1 Tax=Saccharomycodes ludwigii TaxID=36035 RepID=A0A376B9J4_9ASCO|nr:uncharacterized protein SCODWIG_03107 [Saccharomycodes ludwigii]